MTSALELSELSHESAVMKELADALLQSCMRLNTRLLQHEAAMAGHSEGREIRQVLGQVVRKIDDLNADIQDEVRRRLATVKV